MFESPLFGAYHALIIVWFLEPRRERFSTCQFGFLSACLCLAFIIFSRIGDLVTFRGFA
jgi:hypothetical protein